MWFFGLTKTIEGDQPKRPSILGTMFNPRIGDSLRPLGETTSVFVQLIAMVFAMNGLFPKDHPAIKGVEGARLTLSEIFGTAWNSLSFTKEGLPKVILFFAVTGTMIFAVLSVITALLAGLMGTAHADTGATSSGFFAPASSDDLAQNWLDYIFKATPLSNYYSQNGQPIPQTVNIQCAFISALGFYSGAMLVFAAVILFYHLVSMVVNTAHEGVPMGKRASQVWAPIRLVVAVGLLVPIGTSVSSNCGTSGSGLNTGQYIVIQMASWGSGLASGAWSTFINALANTQNTVIKPAVPDVDGMVSDIVLMEACKWTWNYHLCEIGQSSTAGGGNPASCNVTPSSNIPIPPQFANEAMQGPTLVSTDPYTGDAYYRYSTANQVSTSGFDICGSFTIPGYIVNNNLESGSSVTGGGSTIAQNNSTAAITQNLSQAQQTTFNGFVSQFATVGAEIANLNPEAYDGPIPENTDFVNLVNNYKSTLQTNLDAALGSQAAGNSNLDVQTITDIGWAGAGAWLNTIARDQGAIISAYENGMPHSTRPDLVKMVTALDPDKTGTPSYVANKLGGFMQWMVSDHNIECGMQATASAGATSDSGSLSASAQSVVNADNAVAQAAYNDTIGAPGSAAAKTTKLNFWQTSNTIDQLKKALLNGKSDSGMDTVKLIFAVIDTQAQASGIWQSAPSSCTQGTNGSQAPYFTLGAQLVTANPLQEFSFWGYANLRAAYNLWGAVLKLSMAESVESVQQTVQQFALLQGQHGTVLNVQDTGLNAKAYGFIASLFSMFANIFFMTGFTVAFVVPLLPYFRFFFNVITWIVSLLEAIVAVPLIALAHLNPEGEGLPGQSAKAAYFMVFNVFLRPVLTVFGLIAGLLVFYVAIMLLNITFAVAVAGTGAGYHSGLETLVRVAYTLIYGATVYVCANNCFKTIGFFPEHALRWIGAQAHHERMGDGGRAVQGIFGQAQGQLSDKALGTLRLKG